MGSSIGSVVIQSAPGSSKLPGRLGSRLPQDHWNPDAWHPDDVMSVFTWSLYIFFVAMWSTTNSWLFATREIKHQYRGARGTRPRYNCREYFACNLAKIHSHVCTGGKGTVLTLKAFKSVGMHWGSGLCHTQLFSVLHQPHFSLLLSRSVPLLNQGSSGLWAALLSQPRGVLNEWYLLKQRRCRCTTLRTWSGIDPCGSGAGDAEERHSAEGFQISICAV